MNKLSILPGSAVSLDTILAIVREEHPESSTGVVIVFDKDGGMHTHWHCNSQEMALAGANLLRLAASKDQE